MRHRLKSYAAVTRLVGAAVLAVGLARPSAAPLLAQGGTFDHSAFDALLRAHVRNGLVDYDAFEKSPEFKGYLGKLAATDPSSLPRSEQLAFWIDAYNAYTIQLINAHHEHDSIRNINKTFGMKLYGPWKEKLARVGGHDYGLDEIEQDIVRPRYHEPRVHFALVCAAMGCPPLRSEAYTGAKLDAQLDDQARTFLLHSPSKNRVDVASKTVYLSPVLKGFRNYNEDFGGSDAAIGKFVARYYPAGPEKQLLESGDFKIEKTGYSWKLNSQENGAKVATQ